MSQPPKSIRDLSEDELLEIKAQIVQYKENSLRNEQPAIYTVRNRQGKSECHEFVGALGGSSKKTNTRPQIKFKVLPKKIYLASAMDAIFRLNWHEAHPDTPDYNFDGEISHLCHQKWCVNPEHLVRESHNINCERRDYCSRNRCLCEQQRRKPPCV